MRYRSLYVAVDVDGTLTNTNLSFAFGRFLFRHRKISAFQALGASLLYAIHRFGLLSVTRLHRAIFSLLFRGKRRSEFTDWADQFFLCIEPLIRRDVRDEVQILKEEGAHIALLSSSPDFLIERIASFLNISEWYGTEYLFDDNDCFYSLGHVLTGDLKATFVRRVHMGDLMAFSDSILDKPLLDAAQYVVAVYPSFSLRRLAKARGWRIISGGSS